jgi:hypothetical protein
LTSSRSGPPRFDSPTALAIIAPFATTLRLDLLPARWLIGLRNFRPGLMMPLIPTSRPMILIAGTPWAVGVWMQVANSRPDDFVWVIATYECVEDLDHPGHIADQFNATDIAESNRALLERVASAKFDEKGVDPEEGVHDGKRILRLHSYDLPG